MEYEFLYQYEMRDGIMYAYENGAQVLWGEEAVASFNREKKAEAKALEEKLSASKARRKLAKLTEEEAQLLLSTAGIPLDEHGVPIPQEEGE